VIKFNILVISILLLNGCVPLKQQSITLPTSEKTKILETVISPIDTYSEESSYKDDFYRVGGDDVEIIEKRVSKPVEKIPNFQKNEFKSLKTANRNEIKKNIVIRGKNVKVNVESIPLHEFIDFIFSSVLKVNYSVDKKVQQLKQPVTLNMAQSLPKQQLFNVVEKILKDESIVLTKENGTIFIKTIASKIVQNNLSDKYIVFGRKLSSHISDNKKVIMFVPYYYMQPKDSFNILRKMGVNNVTFRYLNNNIQILEGEVSNVRQTLEVINIIDTPSMEEKTPYLLEFDNIEVEKFKSRIETILENNSIPLASNIKDVGIVLNPIDELNALLILSPKKSWLDMIVFWKNKLDVISEVSDIPQLYMYKVKYRKADDFASVLQMALPRNITGISSIPRQLVSHSDGQNRENTIPQSVGSVVKNRVNLSNNIVQIKADLHTNSLMMYLTSAQYKQILPIIKKLDKLPLQVLVEVTLAEVDITNNFNLGFEWSLLNNKALSSEGTIPLNNAHTLTLGGSKGITSTLFKTNLTSLINAFAEDKVLDILSRPSLMILNNKTGNINVGQQVPVISSEVSSNDVSSNTSTPSILRNISYTSTGITVNLTPTINSNGTLTLDIGITLSEAQSNKLSSIDSPLIINRQLSTSIVMHSDDSVLLGGLISHNYSNGETGVPLLKEIPLIGNLFKSQSKAHRKTELIILIHPKIIKNRSELNIETEKFKLLLENLKKL